MKRIFSNLPWKIPLGLLAVVFLAYGIYIPWLGLYGDDWMYLYNYHALGPWSYGSFFAQDRPFSGWVMSISTALLGNNIFAYQVWGVALRWLTAVALWWFLVQLWPKFRRPAVWAALLFSIYPGYLQQAIPLEFYIHYVVLALYLGSMGMMVKAVRQPQRRWAWLIAAVVCSISMFSIEYFVGLELLRPLVLWFVLGETAQKKSKRWVKALSYWAPFFVIFIIFLVWRVFIFKFKTYQPTLFLELISNPLKGALHLGSRIIHDLYVVTVAAWAQIFRLNLGPRTLLLYLGIITAGLVLVSLFEFKMIKPASPEEGGDLRTRLAWIKPAILLALAALLVGGIPIWLPNVPLSLDFPFDRSTLPFMLGSCLLLVVLLELVFPLRIRQLVFIGLAALTLGYTMTNARNYMNALNDQVRMTWQLVWRAPQIQSNTMLIFDNLPDNYLFDNDLTPLVNWTYAPNITGNTIPYRVFDINARSNNYFLDNSPTGGQSLNLISRNLNYSGSPSDIILLSYDAAKCLRVFYPANHYPGLPAQMASVLPESKLNRISSQVSSQIHPPLILNVEPAHTWCYYFEKADLAFQNGDWAGTIALWDQASALHLKPLSVYEFAPFLGAYLHLGQWDQAGQIAAEAHDFVMKKNLTQDGVILCQVWADSLQGLPNGTQYPEKLKKIQTPLGCSSQ